MSDVLRDKWPDEYDLVREVMRRERELAFRKALHHAGYMPKSVELAVQRNRKYLETGEDER